jgi:polysaccharide biosynthesis transport protein
MARNAAEIVRQEYLEESLAQRREQAAKNAAWFNQQAQAARKLAEEAEMVKAAYEKETGIIMQGRETDLDSERLAALAGQAAIPMAPMGSAAGGSSAAMQLAQIDAQLEQASSRLGPNHPEMLELRNRRALVAQVAAQEAASSRAAASGVSASAAIARALQEQKSRVLGQREKVERLRQLANEAELRREQYRTAAARAAQYTQETAIAEVGLTPLGVVVTPTSPAFPNKPLILVGSVGLGFGVGLALALLLELLNRRVRGVEDLNLSSEVRCLGVVERPNGNEARRRLRRAIRAMLPLRSGAPA